MSPADPYGVADAVYLPLEGDGDVRFNDRHALRLPDAHRYQRLPPRPADDAGARDAGLLDRREANFRTWLDGRYPVAQPGPQEIGR